MKKQKHSSKSHKRNGTGKISKKPQRNNKKRVLSSPDEPGQRMLKNGNVRQFDLLCSEENATAIPRKTRDFMARMNRWNSVQTQVPQADSESKKNIPSATRPSRGHGSEIAEKDDKPKKSSKTPSSGKKFDGMKSGETLAEYSTRLKQESRQMAIDIGKKGNHQAEKKKAYNKKCRERAARRKRRRRGEQSDGEVEEGGEYDEETTQSICHLPAYWQEIVNNNGRPVSMKQKKRSQRLERAKAAKSTFGDQVEKPPDLTMRPVRRNKATAS